MEQSEQRCQAEYDCVLLRRTLDIDCVLLRRTLAIDHIKPGVLNCHAGNCRCDYADPPNPTFGPWGANSTKPPRQNKPKKDKLTLYYNRQRPNVIKNNFTFTHKEPQAYMEEYRQNKYHRMKRDSYILGQGNVPDPYRVSSKVTTDK